MKNTIYAICAYMIVTTAVGRVEAGLIYHNDFSTDPAADFTAYNNGINFNWRSASEDIEGTRGDNRVGWYHLTAPETSISDGVVRSTLSVTAGASLPNQYALFGGVTGRISNDSTDYNLGYYAIIGSHSYNTVGGEFYLRLGRDLGKTVNTSAELGTLLGTGTYSVQEETTYVVDLSLQGNQITATLYGADGTTQLDQISVEDFTYTSGQAGLVAALRSGSSYCRRIRLDLF